MSIRKKTKGIISKLTYKKMKKKLSLDTGFFTVPEVEVVIYNEKIALKRKPVIGIFGSSSEFQIHRGFAHKKEIEKLCIELGKIIAKRKWNVVTQGCSGIPYWVAKSAREHGAYVISISPFKSEKEHLRDKGAISSFPIDQHSIACYTNLGFQFCDILVSHLSDVGLVIGGGMGTLRECVSLVEYEKPLICFNESGGVSKEIPRVFKNNFSSTKKLSLLTCNDAKSFSQIINNLSKKISWPNEALTRIIEQLIF